MWLRRKLQRLTGQPVFPEHAVATSSDNSQFDNFFRLFALPVQFAVDSVKLEREYKALQAQFHPDKYAGADAAGRLQALQKTSLVNEGYETLKSPLQRAAYLLQLEGVDPEEHNQAHFGEDFLMQQLVLREDLETLAAEEDMEGLDSLKARVSRDRDETQKRFQAQFEAADYAGAKSTYNQMQFLFKLLAEIDAVEEKLLDY